MNPIRKTILLAATLLVCHVAGAAEGLNPPTDAEIDKAETRLDRVAVTLGNLASFDLPTQFVLRAEEQATLAETKIQDQGGILQDARDAARGAQFVNASTVGWTNSVHNATDTKLMAAAITFEVLDAIFGEKTDKSRWKDSRYELQSPSLYFVSIRKPTPNLDAVALIDERFTEAVKVLKDMHLDCEPAHYKSTKYFSSEFVTRGVYTPGIVHARDYVCGYPGLVDIGIFKTYDERRRVDVNKIPAGKVPSIYDGGSYARVAFDNLQRAKGILKMIDPESTIDPQKLPEVLYDRAKPFLGSDWYAVFTIKSDDKKRHVKVVRGEQQMEFIVP